MNRILILGAGFASLWAAASVARKLNDAGKLSGMVQFVTTGLMAIPITNISFLFSGG